MSKSLSPFSRGFFISFEGPEGAGKTTQAKMLAEYFRSKKMECVLTREPGGTEAGERIRAILKDPSLNRILCDEAEVLLMLASRAQHVRETIIPAMERGAVVLCDRFSDSTFAYQGSARGMPLDVIELMNHFSTSGIEPDLTFLLSVDPRLGLRRAVDRELGDALKDRFEECDIAFHEAVMRGFQDQARLHRERFRVVDADRPIQEVQNDIQSIAAEILQLG